MLWNTSSRSAKSKRNIRRAARAAVEQLEGRVLLSTSWCYVSNNQLYITGTSASDTIIVSQGSTTISVTRNADPVQSVSKSGLTSILVYGNDGNDKIVTYSSVSIGCSLYGGNGNDSLYGGSGNDYLKGDAGDDYLYGNAGNDTLKGADGADHMYGQEGNDTFYAAGDGASDTIDGGNGTDNAFYADTGHITDVLYNVETKPVDDAASTATARTDSYGIPHHIDNLARAKSAMGLLFMGDSITYGWVGTGSATYSQYYSSYKPADFAISGNRTENVLWQCDTELSTIAAANRPKVVVLMIGTNDLSRNSNDSILHGVLKCVSEIRYRLPTSKVLVLGILPRQHPGDASDFNTRIAQINAGLANIDNGSTVRFLDIGSKFSVSGKVNFSLMPDGLHPNADGYKVWAAAMDSTLKQMLA